MMGAFNLPFRLESDGSISMPGPVVSRNTPRSEIWINSRLQNVFDASAPGTVEQYYLNDSGVPVSAATTNISQAIYMAPGTRFVVLSDADSYPSFRGCFFSADGSFHSAIIASPAHAGSTTIFVVPSGAAFAKINYRRANLHFIGVERTSRVSGYDKVSFVGDSNVAGGVGGFSGTAGVTLEMARILGSTTVVNRGVANRQISGAGGMHEVVLTTDPDADAMVVLGGGNDHAAQVVLGAVDSTNTAEFNGALNAICAYFTGKRIWQKLFLCTFTERTGTELAIPVDSYNAAIIAAGVRWTVPVIDLRNIVGADPDMSSPIVNLLYPDGKHWSWYMQSIAADAICRRILEG